MDPISKFKGVGMLPILCNLLNGESITKVMVAYKQSYVTVKLNSELCTVPAQSYFQQGLTVTRWLVNSVVDMEKTSTWLVSRDMYVPAYAS
jgi:hypothetical protein